MVDRCFEFCTDINMSIKATVRSFLAVHQSCLVSALWMTLLVPQASLLVELCVETHPEYTSSLFVRHVHAVVVPRGAHHGSTSSASAAADGSHAGER